MVPWQTNAYGCEVRLAVSYPGMTVFDLPTKVFYVFFYLDGAPERATFLSLRQFFTYGAI